MSTDPREKVRAVQERVLRLLSGPSTGEEQELFSWHSPAFVAHFQKKETGPGPIAAALAAYFPRFFSEGLVDRVLPDWAARLPRARCAAAAQLDGYFAALLAGLDRTPGAAAWWSDLLLIEWARATCLLATPEEFTTLLARLLDGAEPDLTERRHWSKAGLVLVRLKTNLPFLLDDGSAPPSAAADLKSPRDLFWFYFDLESESVRYSRLRSVADLRARLAREDS